MKALGIEWAPFNISFERRLQSYAVFQFVSSFLLLGVSCLISTIYLLFFTNFYWLVFIYFIWFYYDYKTPERGGRRSQFFRSLPMRKYFRDYFPIKLIATSELHPSRNYIIGNHPHGIFCFGAFSNFGTDYGGFSEKFPGIKPTLLTLQAQFKFPFYRDYCMTSGACSCSKESIEWLLSKEGCGNALVIVPGGAKESLECNPSNFNLVLKNRKGFVKIAIKCGANLVPSYSFGENRTYVQLDGGEKSKFSKLQMKLLKILGVGVPIFHGRGIFNYTFGLMPYRTPITTIVGKPIEVEKNENPNQEQVDNLHKLYIQQLEKLFEENKNHYGINDDIHLNII